MFEFRFCKGHGWNHEPKFSIKHCDNGWHRFFEIIIPIKGSDYLSGEVIRYQITYWNYFKTFFGKEKTSNDVSEPGCDRNDTHI